MNPETNSTQLAQGIKSILSAPGMPFMATDYGWAIGIYEGASPFDLRAPRFLNPVLKAHDVTDVKAEFVADPFLVKKNARYYLFFEVLNAGNSRGEIGLAISLDAKRWHYERIILKEPFHLSYPHVFEWQNEFYMIPESKEANAVRLYRAQKFPEVWECIATLFPDQFSDHALLYYQNRWWLWLAKGNDSVYLFYADKLTGPWQEHPRSPLMKDNANYARPAGRLIEWNNQIIRFVQDDGAHYGHQVFAFRVTTLTPDEYREELVSEKPFLAPSGKGWNARKMHHVSLLEDRPGCWIAVVDGMGKNIFFGFRK